MCTHALGRPGHAKAATQGSRHRIASPLTHPNDATGRRQRLSLPLSAVPPYRQLACLGVAGCAACGPLRAPGCRFCAHCARAQDRGVIGEERDRLPLPVAGSPSPARCLAPAAPQSHSRALSGPHLNRESRPALLCGLCGPQPLLRVVPRAHVRALRVGVRQRGFFHCAVRTVRTVRSPSFGQPFGLDRNMRKPRRTGRRGSQVRTVTRRRVPPSPERRAGTRP